MIEHYWPWVLANKEWLLIGASLVVIGALLRFLRKRGDRGISQELRSGASSQNIQAGRDVHLTVREGDEKAQSPRQQFVEDLVTFCSESKAATTKLFLARPATANPDNKEAYHRAFMDCELHDASGQRLQLRAREVFPEAEVQRELFELLRRTSLIRQSLLVTEEAYRDQAFAADQSWVGAQARRAISAAARAAGYDLERGEVPFLIGFHPSFVGELPGEDSEGQPPSSRIIYEYHLARVKEQHEAAGHKWDPSIWTQYGPTCKVRSEPIGIPRRDSEPDICDGRVHNSFPFEEKHVLWLAGYDSRPALLLRDGCFCQLRVLVATRNIQPLKAFEVFKQGRHPIDLISPQVATKACELLREKTSAAVQDQREKLESQLREDLAEDFGQYGYELFELSIKVRLAH